MRLVYEAERSEAGFRSCRLRPPLSERYRLAITTFATRRLDVSRRRVTGLDFKEL